MTRALTTFLLSAGLAVTGCSGSNDPAAEAPSCKPGPTTGDLPCDVGGVLKDKCQTCHTTPEKNGAKFPLSTYEDTQAPFGTTGKRRWQRMAQVIEPGSIPHMPYVGPDSPNTPQLTSDELQTLRDWFHACAPPVAEKTGCDVGE